jgi:hypothetical protein
VEQGGKQHERGQPETLSDETAVRTLAAPDTVKTDTRPISAALQRWAKDKGGRSLVQSITGLASRNGGPPLDVPTLDDRLVEPMQNGRGKNSPAMAALV